MPTSPFRLDNQVVLLTGAAGLYGRGLLTALTDAGARVAIASRNRDAIEQLAAAERQRGGAVEAFAFDQGDEASILNLRDQLLERFGRIDGLVNNAVTRAMQAPTDPLENWARSMENNATGLFAMLRTFGETMRAQGAGSIVNVGSIQGIVGPDFTLYEGLGMEALPDYFFHKAGMANLTRYFAAYLGPAGVRVNCVSPGGFENHQPREFIARYNRKTFLRRMARDGDLGPPIVFLLSAAAAYITGVNLPVDGGYTAH